MERTRALTAPVSSSTSGTADYSGTTHVANSFGAALMPFPSMSPVYNPFPWHDIHGSSQSCPFDCENENSRLGDYVNPFGLADSKTDVNLVDVKNDVSELHKESEIPYGEVNARETFCEIDENNNVTTDHLSKTAISSTSYCESEEDQMNFTSARGETAAGYPMKEHGTEAKATSIRRPQLPTNFSSSVCAPGSLRAGNFGIQGVEKEINFVPVQFGAPGKVDGGFLTLGVGGGTEIRASSNFSTREIASKLNECVPSQLNSSLVRQNTKNPLSLTQLSERGEDIQNSASGLQDSAYNASGRMSASGEIGLMRDMSTWLNSVPFCSLQTPQPNIPNNFIKKSDTFQYDLRPSSLPFGNTPIPRPQHVNSPQLGREPMKPTCFADQQISNQKHNFYRKCFTNVSSGPSSNSLLDRHIESSSSHAQLGHLASLIEGTRTEVTGIGSFSTSVQPVGGMNSHHYGSSTEALGNGLVPERIVFPVSKGNTSRSSGGGPFPRRLGVPNYSVTPLSATGLPPIQLAAPFNSFRHSAVPPGHLQRSIPAQLSLNLPSIDHSTVQVVPKLDFKSQPSPIALHQSLKRQATENSPSERFAQHRKIIPQPVINNSAVHQSQRIQAPSLDTFPAMTRIPAAPLHIKWEGFDGPPNPLGEKCLLCKRDLSFTAEGPVYQPAIPPAVAVLSCGHTFHDRCLEIITPEDQSNDPPCIPCVVGET